MGAEVSRKKNFIRIYIFFVLIAGSDHLSKVRLSFHSKGVFKRHNIVRTFLESILLEI